MNFLMYQLYKINGLPSSDYKVIWGPPVLCLLLYCHIYFLQQDIIHLYFFFKRGNNSLENSLSIHSCLIGEPQVVSDPLSNNKVKRLARLISCKEYVLHQWRIRVLFSATTCNSDTLNWYSWVPTLRYTYTQHKPTHN